MLKIKVIKKTKIMTNEIIVVGASCVKKRMGRVHNNILNLKLPILANSVLEKKKTK